MDIGKPRRIHRVEPVQDPVPAKPPAPKPQREKEPERVTAK